jgi:hypothetical protein
MFETRWARYGDPRNLDWEFDVDMNHASKWERHTWSAYPDLVATESERDLLLERVRVLEGALAATTRCLDETLIVVSRAVNQRAGNATAMEVRSRKAIEDARAALAAKGE